MVSKHEQHIESIKTTITHAVEGKEQKKLSLVLLTQRIDLLKNKYNIELDQKKLLKQIDNLFLYNGTTEGKNRLKTRLFIQLNSLKSVESEATLDYETEGMDDFINDAMKPFGLFSGSSYRSPYGRPR